MQGQIQEEKIIKSIMDIAPKHCENCGTKYSEENFKVMKSAPGATLIHLKCASCSTTYMLNVVTPNNGVIGTSRAPIVLDLISSNEFEKFAGIKSVSKQEALDIYEQTEGKNFDKFLKHILKTPTV